MVFGAAMCPVKTNYPRGPFMMEAAREHHWQEWMLPGWKTHKMRTGSECPVRLRQSHLTAMERNTWLQCFQFSAQT